jgi:hypothetical protein
VAIDPGFAFGSSMDKAAAYAISALIIGYTRFMDLRRSHPLAIGLLSAFGDP